jgi:hypothetical protein
MELVRTRRRRRRRNDEEEESFLCLFVNLAYWELE